MNSVAAVAGGGQRIISRHRFKRIFFWAKAILQRQADVSTVMTTTVIFDTSHAHTILKKLNNLMVLISSFLTYSHLLRLCKHPQECQAHLFAYLQTLQLGLTRSGLLEGRRLAKLDRLPSLRVWRFFETFRDCRLLSPDDEGIRTNVY